MNRMRKFIPMNQLLYRFCKQYVDLYNGENNCDMISNGELRLLKKVLPKCKIIFDVGANIGEWTCLVKNINPKCEVHCFEPSLATFNKLQSKEYPGKVIKNNFGSLLQNSENKMFFWLLRKQKK